MINTILVHTKSQGLFEITHEVQTVVSQAQLEEGLCTLFIQHTSASLIIQENADPSAKRDLENWMSRLVVEGDRLYTHTSEGLDDMPSHIKTVLTQTSICIPVQNSCLALGTWQGIYVWEHRRGSHKRSVVIHVK